MKTPQVIHTERLILRPYLPQDAASLLDHLSDYDVVKTTLNIPHPYSMAEAEEYVKFATTSDETKIIMRAITRKPENDNAAYSDGAGSLIGSITLRIESRHHRAETGYWIGKPYWGMGYASEALAGMIQFGFEGLGLNKILATAFPSNPASSRVMQKCGMSYEGRLREHVQRDGVFYDLDTFGILKKDYVP